MAKKTLPAEKAVTQTADYSGLIKQIESEYTVALTFIRPKWEKWKERLKLYSNQKRDKTAVGDPLLFSIFQTVLASLYADRLSVSFGGREEGDEDVEENLTALAEYDYEEMGKDELDFEWDWNASFFGRALCLQMEFDRTSMTPIPEIVDPMTLLRDPKASSLNGDSKGRGAARYWGREIRLTKQEMKDRNAYGDVFININQIKTGTGKNEIDQNRDARRDAQGYSSDDKELEGDNKDYRVLEWFTRYKGKRVLVTLANERKLVVRYQVIDGKEWPATDRAIYPIPHDWDGVSIPDLIEDKQRGRARLINAGLKIVEKELLPNYLFDSTKILNRKDLERPEANKFIPIEGSPSGAIVEIPTSSVKADAGWILALLDTSAQKATATPDIQMGATASSARSATEVNTIQSKVDTRYSLTAKIFGWSDKRFWKKWYQIYKKHFVADISQKIIRIVGSGGPRWRTLTRENIISSTDPDIKIESTVIATEKRTRELQAFMNWAKMIALEPGANKRFINRKMGKLSGLTKDELDMALPLSIDELDAEAENEELDLNDIKHLPEVLVTDDHVAHLLIHEKAADTAARTAHVKAHRKAMLLKRLNPGLVPPSPSEQTISGQDQPSTPMNTGSQPRMMPGTAPGPALG